MIRYESKSFAGTEPELGQNVFVAEGANVVGTVTIGDETAVGHKALVRADGNVITIGEHSVISDLAVVHVAGVYSACVGNYTVIGARSIVHGASVGSFCYVADNAKVLDGSEVGDCSIIRAGTVVAKDSKIPPYSVVAGIPGKVVGKADFDEKEHKEFVLKMRKMLFGEKQ